MGNGQCESPEAAKGLLCLRTQARREQYKRGQYPKLATERECSKIGAGFQPELLSQWLGIWRYYCFEVPCDQITYWKTRKDIGFCLLYNTHKILRFVTESTGTHGDRKHEAGGVTAQNEAMGILMVDGPSLETWKRLLGEIPAESGKESKVRVFGGISRSTPPCPPVTSMGHLCNLCEQVVCKHELEGHTEDHMQKQSQKNV